LGAVFVEVVVEPPPHPLAPSETAPVATRD